MSPDADVALGLASSITVWTVARLSSIRSILIGVAPQLIVSWRIVRSSGLKPRIGASGRNRAMARTVNPEREMQQMAFGSICWDACQVARVMVSVTARSPA